MHLAQLNIARMKFGPDDPVMKDFMDALDSVNEQAESHSGFIWRLVSDTYTGPDLTEFEQRGWLVNMSVWISLNALKSFIVAPLHLSIMKRRAEWFQKWPQATMVLWWVDEGHIPDFTEALSRLEWLRENGPGPRAFTFAQPFEPD